MVKINGHLTFMSRNTAKVLLALEDEDFSPNLNRLAKRTGLPRSTVSDQWAKILEDVNVRVTLEAVAKVAEEHGC